MGSWTTIYFSTAVRQICVCDPTRVIGDSTRLGPKSESDAEVLRGLHHYCRLRFVGDRVSEAGVFSHSMPRVLSQYCHDKRKRAWVKCSLGEDFDVSFRVIEIFRMLV